MDLKSQNKYNVEVGDYILYTGISGSGYTFNKYYEINNISALMCSFENDDGQIRVFLSTKANSYGWKHIKKYELRKNKIQKIKDNICSKKVIE